MNWPADADGNVLRKMQERGFDFSKKYVIDFNVDFDEWPPSKTAVAVLSREHPSTRLHEPIVEDRGYIQFQIFAPLTYDLVINTQSYVTELVAPYGGYCESWGVLHD
jgi:Regulator of ribonuclease activity B